MKHRIIKNKIKLAALSLLTLAIYAVTGRPAVAEIIMGPYLQNPTGGTITVMWQTDEPGPSIVLYWKGGTDIRKATGEPGSLHEVTVKGLEEDKLYRYRVLSGKDLSEQYTFRTTTRKPKPFRFVAFGDSRGNDDEVEDISRHVTELDPPAAFAIHTGDVVDDGRNEGYWKDQFFGPQHPMMASLPVYFAMGNHDHASKFYFGYLSLPGNERWYSFEYADAVFFCLDTTADYTVGSEQYRWFESALERYADKPWKFVFFHHPPYSTSYHGPDETVQKHIVPLLGKYGVDIVFNGHEHNYERTVMNGVTYIVTGGYGAPRYPRVRHAEGSLKFSREHHFCLIDVDGDKAEVTVIADDGKLIEKTTIEHTR